MEAIVRLNEARTAAKAARAVFTAHPSPTTDYPGKRALGAARGLAGALLGRAASAAGCGSGRRLGAARAGSQAAQAAGGQAAQAAGMTQPACSRMAADPGLAERRGAAAGKAGGRPLVPIGKSSAFSEAESSTKSTIFHVERAHNSTGRCYKFLGGPEGGLQPAFGGAQ